MKDRLSSACMRAFSVANLRNSLVPSPDEDGQPFFRSHSEIPSLAGFAFSDPLEVRAPVRRRIFPGGCFGFANRTATGRTEDGAFSVAMGCVGIGCCATLTIISRFLIIKFSGRVFLIRPPLRQPQNSRPVAQCRLRERNALISHIMTHK